MLFSTSTVLSTLAVAGNVAASNLHHGHAQFHAKRDVQAKRDYDTSKVNWAEALKNVDFSQIDYSKPSTGSQPAAPPASPAPSKEPEASKPTYGAPASNPAPSSSKPAAPSQSSKPDDGGIGGAIGDFIKDVSGWASKLGVSTGVNNEQSKDGNMWLGSDGKYKATFTNDGDKSVAIICWNAQGMWINAHKPEIFVNIEGGKSVTVSIPAGKSGGCGAAASDSSLFYGLLNESILEFTTGDNEKGCFDVSREINMGGLVMSAKGSQCTSGISNGDLSCVFVCHEGNSCENAGTYGIALGSAKEGPCMVGNAKDGGSSGGCQFGANGEHIQVTVSNSRSWPKVSGKVH